MVENVGQDEFYGEFVAKRRPVVIRGLTSDWRARDWGVHSFRTLESTTTFAVKVGNVADGRRVRMSLAEYADAVERYEERGQAAQSPGYLHDVPIFRFFPDLTKAVAPFPLHLFPRWYRESWQEYAQFFMGPTGSVTPLHVDTLLTHNLFFHLVGRKRFILIPADQRDLCHPTSWRWMRYDPGAPWKNGHYNLLSLLGVGLGVPSKIIFPLYRSYLTYVS